LIHESIVIAVLTEDEIGDGVLVFDGAGFVLNIAEEVLESMTLINKGGIAITDK
jgi:hypothetical protein